MLVFDSEIIKAIPNKKEEPIEGIEYCEGWKDFEGMGISVIGVYDYIDNRYRVFMQDNFNELQELIEQRDVMVGFNQLGFDNNLLEANGIRISHKMHYDLLAEIWKADGLEPEFRYPTHMGYGLDAVCETNFGIKKTGDGAKAPILWQQGQIAQVTDYCLNDVRMTKKLLDHILFYKKIKSPKEEKVIEFDIPDKIEYLMGFNNISIVFE